MLTPTIPKLLVVDDDPDLLEVILEFLSLEEIECLTANSVEDALTTLQEHRVAAIVTDISLLKQSDFDLVKKLRASGRNLPLILLTGNDSAEYQEMAKDWGAIGIIEKPFSPKALITLAKKALQMENTARKN